MASLIERAISRYAQWRFPENTQVVRQASINGYQMLVLANEEVGRSILFHHRYEPLDTALMQRVLLPTDICADIGANTGYYSFLMGSVVTQGEVHAFEPSPLSHALLKAGALLNNYTSIQTLQAAVCAQESTIDFSLSTDGAYASIIASGRKPEKKLLRVTSISVDGYMEREGIPRFDVIKIDVEGAELEVLNGAGDLFGNSARRPRVVLIELCTRNLIGFDTTIPEILDKMASFGYLAYVPTGSLVRPYTEADYDRIFNVFFSANAVDLV